MKEKAIEVVKNLTKTIDQLNGKKEGISLTRTDMFSNPTASRSHLIRKRETIINKYNLKEKEWK